MTSSQRPSALLLAILEGFLDGILVLTHQKQVLYVNNIAYQLCQQLTGDEVTHAVPDAIWQSCEMLSENQALHPEQLIMMESDLKCENNRLRVRVQLLSVDGCDRPCFLVRLQDQQQAAQSLANTEAQHWQLTERETEVWHLRREGLTRKEIAAKLYISQDTVKKHLGNVQAKRLSYLDEAAWQVEQLGQVVLDADKDRRSA